MEENSKETFVVSAKDQGKKLDEFLTEYLSLSRKKAKQLLDSRCVYVNDRRVWIASHLIKKGDKISVYGTKKEKVTLTARDILYKDEHYVVIQKPSGILSNGKGSVETELQKLLKDKQVRAVHRLDRETSGCLLFARSQNAWDAIVEKFDEVQKTYLALVYGKLSQQEIRISVPIDGKSAESFVKVKKFKDGISLVEVSITTGRTHQIRKHMLHIGHSILGDKVYMPKKGILEKFRSVPRQMLHAYKLYWKHPFTEVPTNITAHVPIDFESTFQT